jgi:hypothetical protein
LFQSPQKEELCFRKQEHTSWGSGSVTKAVRKLLTNPAITALTVHKLAEDGIALETAQQALKNIDKVWETLHFQEQRKIVKLLIEMVAVDNSGIKILLNHEGSHKLIKEITALHLR